jgi:hypothetical protein
MRTSILLLAAALGALPVAARAQRAARPAHPPHAAGSSHAAPAHPAGSAHVDPHVIQQVVDGANRNHVDVCVAMTIVAHESGGHPEAIHHDENAGRCHDKLARCGTRNSHARNAAQNDDTPNRAADDLGLDWRFSHGLGLGQVTPGTGQCEQDAACGSAHASGIRLNGHSYTPKQLVEMPGSLDGMLDFLHDQANALSHWPAVIAHGDEARAMLMFTAWGGHYPCCNDHTAWRMATYRLCKSNPGAFQQRLVEHAAAAKAPMVHDANAFCAQNGWITSTPGPRHAQCESWTASHGRTASGSATTRSASGSARPPARRQSR